MIIQRKIVSNIFKCNLITCLFNGKYRKKLHSQIPIDCVFNLTNILSKMEIIFRY